MRNKILTVVLVAGIATTGFGALSSANINGTGGVDNGRKGEIRQLFNKVKSGDELTTEEQARLDNMNARFAEGGEQKLGKRGFNGFGKRAGFGQLTDEEKTALETMTDEEKKEFFDEKKEEMKARKDAHKEVIDALIAGETLTSEQEELRTEMLENIGEKEGKRKGKEGALVIEKLLKGEDLSDEDEETLDEIQVKHAEREAKRAEMEPIIEKVKAGEDLTDSEQAIYDEHREKKGKGKGKGHGFGGGHKGGNR